MTMTGGCLCGQVRYVAEAEPLLTAVCHCRNCQRQAGSAFSVVVAVPTAAVSVTGTLKTYDDIADSGGRLFRRFCPDCGSPIFSVMAAQPGLTIIKAGSLDDASGLQPQLQVWCKSAQPWAAAIAGLPAFQENPPQ